MLLERIKQWRQLRKVCKKSTYTKKEFTQHIDMSKVDVVFELGSRDCKDALAIYREYRPITVYSFECNPEAVAICRQTLKDFKWVTKNIHLVERAVWSEQKTIEFFSVVDSKDVAHVNIGASSCFEVKKDYVEKFTQKKVQVPAVRLDAFLKERSINKIDLLCVDLQGAEYHALLGLGEGLKDVSYIIVELETEPIYQGQHLFGAVEKYLNENGFKLKESVMETEKFGDFLFVNQRLVSE